MGVEPRLGLAVAVDGKGGQPSDVVFLTCDAFGVLPPVSALSPAHAMYHFISGYTAKVAGTEVGVTEPQATFSACCGAPFLVWHPTRYAELLAEKIRRPNLWLRGGLILVGLAAVGILVNYLRDRTDSIYPGVVVHGLFNGIALAAAVLY